MSAGRKILRPAVLLCAVTSCSHDVESPIAFKGSSRDLKETVVLATLDEPIPNGKNAVWCASFQVAWKALQSNVVREPIQLEGAPKAATSLNEAPDPRSSIPQESLCAKAGWVREGIVKNIEDELRRRFPKKHPPDFGGLPPDSFLAYAYMEADVHFPIPYTQKQAPLVFTDAAGKTSEIRSFGISEDDKSYDRLRAQARVLFRKGDERSGWSEFAIDLCSNSQPSQIVVAKISREPTLEVALSRVASEATRMVPALQTNWPYLNDPHQIAQGESLVVPDLYWFISHRFSELERKLANKGLEGQSIDVAWQDVLFRLSRKGAELKSEAGLDATAAAHPEFRLDGPFLVYMKKRDAEQPYFAMWVDNAELLCPWRGKER